MSERSSPGIISERYDDSRANAEHKIPVHIIFTDANQHEPLVRFGEQSNAQIGSLKATQVEHEVGSSDISKAHNLNKHGDSNNDKKQEHFQSPLSQTSNFNSELSVARNEHDHIKLTNAVHGGNFEDRFNNNYTELNQQFDKTQNKDAPPKINSESNDKVKPLNTEDNVTKKETLSTVEHLPEVKSKRKDTILTDFQASNIETEISGVSTLQSSSTGQLKNPLDNPILTHLTKRQPLGTDSNNLDTISTEIKVNTPQNVRREISHQQTIIPPNPYLHQQYQTQETNPAYYPLQYATAQQQQVSSLSNTQFFTNPAHADSPGNMAQRVDLLHGQGNQNFVDSNLAKLPHASSNPENSRSSVTILTLYPTIRAVMHTFPSTGFTGTSAPSQLSTYASEATIPYKQSFNQPLFRGVSSPVNLPNTRLIYNGPQPSSRVQWPLAGYFPIIINDPLLTMYNMLTNMIEYGPEADVCKRTKNFRQGRSRSLLFDEDQSTTKSDEETAGMVRTMENGGWSEVSKNGNPLAVERKMSDDVTREDKEENGGERGGDEERKNKDEDQNTEVIMETEKNGNSGPYITRLMVRKGGVSIAGPGGIATAGSGGTAIVGPGGVAYTSPNGLAVVGPGGKVVGLPAGADLSVTATNSNSEGSTPRFFNIPPGGKILATGPVVYFHPPE
ncbi:uncharacterized protein LOC110837305 [Zootermopsis nevadensis]|uniref:DUF4774 domain-containing protein n=1 Tax=Zootermopsis nevadensis TaxID=136037 RepID=A0A067QR82_ZOONE|nr:uncharacterized protein LOC110837305 [Zootermopsis nevadensis]KDR11173.1 hypothetical protein L798_14681 [Zootermopsis nevadensis]